ncbi:uncharacterized protein LOC120697871 isoform X1 [Panicum virgatum]|uniref:Alpha/beta-Hydrolases superfamily protein n=1 Tax=Panicum virgatum TaxID=38727 RepID=A0A8T0V0Q3_PANVG|nr:uncharacterized protein LOC120697871 isoform X1 [Panicum virgatum]XP_039837172.1 uncharacterized protein LOC120697871 isoform X1 [Panicum virgatum]KAG2625839.1 hypothetical protein PVAP13_3KG296100 [Panicum virgatum]
MEDYFSRFLNLGWQLRQYLTELIENLLGYIDWIPQRLEIQFSASHGGSLPGTTGYIHEEAYALSISKTTTEEQTANGISEGTIFRKKFSAIYQRSYGRSSYLLHGFGVVRRLAFHVRDQWSLFLSEVHAKLTRILHRFWTTLQGSREDIGWLQRTRASLCSVDGTGRFKEILNEIRNGLHCLPDTLVYLFIPGLFSNHSPLYFTNTKRFFSKMGLACHIAKIHSESSVEKNAWELKQYIEELYWGSGKKVLLLGHSKGGVDAAAALSLYWSELKGKVAGLALVQSPYGGSPVASDILREGQIADKEARRIMELIVCRLIKGDMRALEDLTYDKRKDFISKHKLPVDELPVISFHTEASTAPTVLTTLTRIAQAELLPWLPLPRFFPSASEFVESMLASLKVPVVAPVSAAMAVTALHLRLRYGESSDGLVTRRDAEVPGSVLVRPKRKLDHAWMVYSTLKKGSTEADASEMCEALLAMLVEIGRNKKFR